MNEFTPRKGLKLPDQTASRALTTDSNSKVTASSVTSTELGYLSGVTSAIQTQLNTNSTGLSDHLSDTVDAHDASAISNVPAGNLAATTVQAALDELQTDIDTRQLRSTLTTKGDIYVATASDTVTRLPVGTNGYTLQADSAQAEGIKWAAPAAVAIGDSITSATAGSIFFAGTAGVLAQDNANLFYDDTNNRVYMGYSTGRANLYNSTVSATLQIEGTTQSTSTELIARNSNDANGSALVLGKTRGTTNGATTVIQSGDSLGKLSGQGSDGTEFVEAASIDIESDGTPGANDMPGRILFKTTADGAATPTERVRIDSTGAITIAGLTGTGTQGTAVTSAGVLTRASRPTVQKFTSGSGTYTTPAGVSYINVKMVGGGGSGGGGGTSGGAGTAGNDSTFGTMTCGGGGAGSNGSGSGGAGGTVTGGIGVGSYISGQTGFGTYYDAISPMQLPGGAGGSSPYFGGGGNPVNNSAGGNAVTNTGGGGAGGGVNSTVAYGGTGGGSGGFADVIITNPSATYSYTVGAEQTSVGAAGTGGFAGGRGAAGYIIVTEYYN